MARIAVVGAGQSGSQLALGLLRSEHEVTLVNDRSPEEIRSGPVRSSSCMFRSALDTERALGLDFWEDECPAIESIEMQLGAVDPVRWAAPLAAPAKAVDQRLKCAAWCEEVPRRGGRLIINSADVADLEEYACTHDLVVVATGRGDIGRLFTPDRMRSQFDRPQRALALTYVTGMSPAAGTPGIRYTAIPSVGEYFTFPALTTSGACDVMVFEGVPGGPMDCWDDVTEPEDHLARSLEILRDLVPSEYARCADVALTDQGGVLRGRFTPQVRRPVATLPSGRQVLGMGNAVVHNDPISGQGANLAAHAATYYLDAITRHGGDDFDDAWMSQTFEQMWRSRAQWVVEWTNSLLRGHLKHHPELFAEAAQNPDLASTIANGFDDPREFFQWWFDPGAAKQLMSEKRIAISGRFDGRALRRALGQYATGVTVVTARGSDGRRVGMTVNSFTPVSMDPPLVLWCPSRSAPSLPAFTEATHFAVNVLGAEHEHLCGTFSTPAVDKFAEVEIVDGKGGVPTIAGALARFECRTVRCLDAGDHVVVLGEIEHYQSNGGTPLIFHGGALHNGLYKPADGPGRLRAGQRVVEPEEVTR